MTSDEPKDEPLTEEELAELEKATPVSTLLKRSLASAEEAPPGAEAALLASVQRKLRQRSRGKFYGDGWSTSTSTANYALIALIMLATIVAIWLVLGPTGFTLR